MAVVTVNGRDVEIGDQENLNLIQAAQRAGVEIPHYCWHPALSVVASCRMCLVEVGEKKVDESVVMQPRLVPACQTPARPGTVVITDSPKVRQAQAATLEFLLLNHPLDCPVCDQAGECLLQDYSYKYGRARSRLHDEKLIRPDKDYIGDQIVLFTDRCIMCTRCVRFTREVSGTAELQVVGRGDHAEIDIFPGNPCNNKLAGNVVDLCPVGALCSKDFLYKQRVWFLKQQKSVCPHCSTGCSIWIDWNKNIVYRIRPRYNPNANGYFMCDDGRFGYHHINSRDRLTQPLRRRGDSWITSAWKEFREELIILLQTLSESGQSSCIALVLSPWLTLEEAWLACQTFRFYCPEAKLIRGPLRDLGLDDRYPKGPRGEAPPPERTKFVIRGEKAPNCMGIDLLLSYFQGRVLVWQDLIDMVSNGQVYHVYFLGGDPLYRAEQTEISQLAKVKNFILCDLLPNGLEAIATWIVPATSFAEKDGAFVNAQGLAQSVRRAVNPRDNIYPESQLFWELSGQTGLYDSASVRRSIANAIPRLRALAVDDLGEHGIFISN